MVCVLGYYKYTYNYLKKFYSSITYNPRTIKIHYEQFKMPFSCSYCGLQCKSIWGRTRHIREKHNINTWYQNEYLSPSLDSRPSKRGRFLDNSNTSSNSNTIHELTVLEPTIFNNENDVDIPTDNEMHKNSGNDSSDEAGRSDKSNSLDETGRSDESNSSDESSDSSDEAGRSDESNSSNESDRSDESNSSNKSDTENLIIHEQSSGLVINGDVPELSPWNHKGEIWLTNLLFRNGQTSRSTADTLLGAFANGRISMIDGPVQFKNSREMIKLLDIAAQQEAVCFLTCVRYNYSS